MSRRQGEIATLLLGAEECRPFTFFSDDGSPPRVPGGRIAAIPPDRRMSPSAVAAAQLLKILRGLPVYENGTESRRKALILGGRPGLAV